MPRPVLAMLADRLELSTGVLGLRMTEIKNSDSGYLELRTLDSRSLPLSR